MADQSLGQVRPVAQCRACGETKAQTEFYASTINKSGNAGACKECTRARVRINRDSNAEYYRAYDRKRYRENEHRKQNARKSASSEAAAAARARYAARLKEESPEKLVARNAVNNALRDGKIARASECFFCGAAGELHAHHEDYSHPLDVVWLCPSCHGKLHTIRGDFRRADHA